MADIFGPQDRHVKCIEKALDVTVTVRQTGAEIEGDEENVNIAANSLEILQKIRGNQPVITEVLIEQAMELAKNDEGETERALEAMNNVVIVSNRGKPIKCKTIGQQNYIKAIKENTVTICIGPAGTGKTYLATALAVAALKRKEISRIILTRPAVEAGEKLGFLPGDLQQKVDPYLRPLYDSLYEFLGQETVHKYLEDGTIEVAPLAYMRGRTLSSCYVILDEGQNTTLDTLMMVLTRFGEGAKVIINGDTTQVDLFGEASSGLELCTEILKGIDDIAVVKLSKRDVVRHKLVKQIVDAFEKYKAKNENKPQQNRPYPRRDDRQPRR
ncbi:MAG: PhoH family protein [Christensenellaceae bacterium]|nr:PhoH family protein [Christensenellaceae bacterium]